MPVAALGSYTFKPADARENFNGKQLLYLNWEKHRLFSRPMVLCLSPDTPFSHIIETIVPDAYSLHPDFENIDWNAVTWIKSGKPFTPDPAKTLAENGLGHKDLIRMVTPGLDGLRGMGA